MEFISLFFIFLSIFIIIYLFYTFKFGKRMPLLIEVLSIGFYFIILIVFLFPNILNLIQNIFGIKSAINFIIYISIFFAYFLIFSLYKKTEEQRVEITKLVREISYLNENGKTKK